MTGKQETVPQARNARGGAIRIERTVKSTYFNSKTMRTNIQSSSTLKFRCTKERSSLEQFLWRRDRGKPRQGDEKGTEVEMPGEDR